MANFVTTAYGVVTRLASTNGELPALSVSDDPWLDVSSMNPHPVVGDHYDGSSFTLDKTALSAAQGAKIAELRDLCADHIKNLGYLVSLPHPAGSDDEGDATDYIFPSKGSDQATMHANTLAMLMNPNRVPPMTVSLWCGIAPTNQARVPDAVDWEIRDFTWTQMLQASDCLAHHLQDASYELRDETNAALAATTVQEVEAVTWNRPNS